LDLPIFLSSYIIRNLRCQLLPRSCSPPCS
jgi:hypothetical protein